MTVASFQPVVGMALPGFWMRIWNDWPWVADGLQRESAEMRQQIHRQLLQELGERAIPFLQVEGTLQQRLLQVERLLTEFKNASAPTA